MDYDFSPLNASVFLPYEEGMRNESFFKKRAFLKESRKKEKIVR